MLQCIYPTIIITLCYSKDILRVAVERQRSILQQPSYTAAVVLLEQQKKAVTRKYYLVVEDTARVWCDNSAKQQRNKQ